MSVECPVSQIKIKRLGKVLQRWKNDGGLREAFTIAIDGCERPRECLMCGVAEKKEFNEWVWERRMCSRCGGGGEEMKI